MTHTLYSRNLPDTSYRIINKIVIGVIVLQNLGLKSNLRNLSDKVDHRKIETPEQFFNVLYEETYVRITWIAEESK